MFNILIKNIEAVFRSDYGGVDIAAPFALLVIAVLALLILFIMIKAGASMVKKIIVLLIIISCTFGSKTTLSECLYKTTDWYLASLPSNTAIVMIPVDGEDTGTYQAAIDNGFMTKVDSIVSSLKNDGYVDHVLYVYTHIAEDENDKDVFTIKSIDGINIADEHFVTAIGTIKDEKATYIGSISNVPAIAVVSREMDAHYYTFTTKKKALVQWDGQVAWLDNAYDKLKKGSSVK